MQAQITYPNLVVRACDLSGNAKTLSRNSALVNSIVDTALASVKTWSFSFDDEKQRGQDAQALVYDGVIYVTASYSRIFALDHKTGKKLWSYTARLSDDIRPSCDVVNRDAAIYNGKIFMGTLDAAMIALDAKTGKVVWREKFGDQKIGYTMTGAPAIIKDQKTGKVMLIHGSSGDEFGVVGWPYARDPDTGRRSGHVLWSKAKWASSTARARLRPAIRRRRPGRATTRAS